MATIKSYTDLEQSKKLAEILPLESADGGWHGTSDPFAANNTFWLYTKYSNKAAFPAWSLAALLGVLPKEIKDEDYENEIIPLLYPMQGKWYMVYNEIDTDGYCPYLEKTGSTPIDACYEMILKLNGLNLL